MGVTHVCRVWAAPRSAAGPTPRPLQHASPAGCLMRPCGGPAAAAAEDVQATLTAQEAPLLNRTLGMPFPVEYFLIPAAAYLADLLTVPNAQLHLVCTKRLDADWDAFLTAVGHDEMINATRLSKTRINSHRKPELLARLESSRSFPAAAQAREHHPARQAEQDPHSREGGAGGRGEAPEGRRATDRRRRAA